MAVSEKNSCSSPLASEARSSVRKHPLLERDVRDALEGDPAADHVHGERLVRAGGGS